ncbi:MAG TPA: hypothetical protein VFQ24_03650 [Terriglobia bacterium]|nr:hypothetical protein [Terriglobia bacterium]
MDAEQMIKLRRKAEEAVSDMPEGELKLKAFEVILTNLLLAREHRQVRREESPAAHLDSAEGRARKKAAVPTSKRDRILELRNEDYFRDQRTISEVRQELATHGWHYPLTALSGVLQDLVQRRELRRQKAVEGKKKVWKYSNA